MLSIFENVNEADFSEKEYDKIQAVVSREGEKIPVSRTLTISTFP